MSYAGRDALGVPHYLTRPFSPEERELLRRRFGIEDPGRLYLSDSSDTGHLDYDTERDPGAGRLVRSYRLGAPSIRRSGESWEELERRLRTMRPGDFGSDVRVVDTTLAALDSVARPRFERLIVAARAAGLPVRVAETYRSPERQAYLMVLGGGLTFTATSMHSAGHAVDLVVGHGDRRNPAIRARWIAFRRWVAGFEGGRFRLLGTPEPEGRGAIGRVAAEGGAPAGRHHVGAVDGDRTLGGEHDGAGIVRGLAPGRRAGDQHRDGQQDPHA